MGNVPKLSMHRIIQSAVFRSLLPSWLKSKLWAPVLYLLQCPQNIRMSVGRAHTCACTLPPRPPMHTMIPLCPALWLRIMPLSLLIFHFGTGYFIPSSSCPDTLELDEYHWSNGVITGCGIRQILGLSPSSTISLAVWFGTLNVSLLIYKISPKVTISWGCWESYLREGM